MPRERVYLDACGWIAFYPIANKPDCLSAEQREGLQTLMQEVENGTCMMIGSAILLTQLLTISGEYLDRAFDNKKGALMPVDSMLAQKARELQHKLYSLSDGTLSCEDAIHLCTASLTKCIRFVTLDKTPDNRRRILAPLKHRSMLEKELGLKIVDPAECRGIAAQPDLYEE